MNVFENWSAQLSFMEELIFSTKTKLLNVVQHLGNIFKMFSLHYLMQSKFVIGEKKGWT